MSPLRGAELTHKPRCNLSEPLERLQPLHPLRLNHIRPPLCSGMTQRMNIRPICCGVQSMKEGSLLLVDELSLAEDSVLERLNSVLEPGRSLALAEKGGAVLETVRAAPGWLLLATMNPG